MALTQSQIIDKLSETDESLTKKQIKALLESFAQLSYKEAKKGFTIPGIGKLMLGKRKARKIIHPATGVQMKIPAKTVVKFRVSKTAQDSIVGVSKALKPKAKSKKKR